MNFKEIFNCFMEHQKDLKVVSVASCDDYGKPNSAPKMLVEVKHPDQIFFLDYKFTQTHSNLKKNPQLSISFMDDDSFTGYRLTGTGKHLTDGKEYETAKKSWEKRLISYEADRIVKRVQGLYSTREAENSLPQDFVITKFTAREASVVKPDRVLRAIHPEGAHE